MADPRGFLKVRQRETQPRRPVPVRIMDWKEVYEAQEKGVLKSPGRPLHGLRRPVLPPGLPAGQPHSGVERPHLAGQGRGSDRAAARHQQLPRVHRPAVPGPLRGVLRAGHQPARRDHQAGRGLHRGPGLRERLGQPAAAGPPQRQDGRRRRLRPRRARRRAAADPRGPHRRRLRARRQDRRAPALRHPRLQDGKRARGPPAGADEGRRHPLPHRRRRRHRRDVGAAAPPVRRRRGRHRRHRPA